MPLQTWCQTLYSMPVDGAALTNVAATATSLLPAAANSDPGLTLPANFFAYIGQQLIIRAAGRVSNVVTTPGTLTLDVTLGGTVVFTSGAMQMSTTAHTSLPIWYEIYLTLRAIGQTANLMGQGKISGQPMSLTAVADSTTTVGTLMMPNTAPAVGGNFNSRVSQLFDHRATFSVATATTSIQLHQLQVISMN